MPVSLQFDDMDLDEFVRVARDFGGQKFGYVVTPNVDHLIRYHDDAAFRATYADATYVLLDSRVVAGLLRLVKGLRAKVCPGSDLTAALFERVVQPQDRILMIGGSDTQAQQLAQRFSLRDLRHYNPPMGFIRDPAAVEATARFVEDSAPFRFCLLAVGAPQQELLAQQLLARGKARGLALCIGASVNFLTGGERRAPRWMQQASLEWLYRLLQSPGRLGRRYLVRGPRIFLMLPGMNFSLRR